MTNGTTGEGSWADLPVPAGGDPASMDEWAARLVDQARADGVALTGDGGLLTDLMRHVLQRGLEVELSEHLGYERHAVEGKGSGNSRNGSYSKMVTTEIGEVEVLMPRDRAGTFEPVTIPIQLLAHSAGLTDTRRFSLVTAGSMFEYPDRGLEPKMASISAVWSL